MGRDKKRTKFINPMFGKFSEPLTVVDAKGRIVLWYLPGLISQEHQVGFSFCTEVGSTEQYDIDRCQTGDSQYRVPIKKFSRNTVAR
jgi:hypothetical protein